MTTKKPTAQMSIFHELEQATADAHQQLDKLAAAGHAQVERVHRSAARLHRDAAAALGAQEAVEALSVQLREHALARVESNADTAWVETAAEVVEQLRLRLLPAGGDGWASFTSDDVWPILDALPVETHERRALGPVIMRAKRAGLIRCTGHRPSVRRHATMIPIWINTEDPC